MILVIFPVLQYSPLDYRAASYIESLPAPVGALLVLVLVQGGKRVVAFCKAPCTEDDCERLKFDRLL